MARHAAAACTTLRRPCGGVFDDGCRSARKAGHARQARQDEPHQEPYLLTWSPFRAGGAELWSRRVSSQGFR